MKAKELVEQLQQFDPDEQIIALVWYKDSFEPNENDDYVLTDEAWNKVVEEFMVSGGLDDHDQAISEQISDAVSEHSEERVEE